MWPGFFILWGPLPPIKEWIIRNQFGRRNLIPFQKADLALTLEDVVNDIAKRAKEKQRQHGGTAPGKTLFLHAGKVNTDKTGGASPQPFQHEGKAEKVHTDKELAKIAGVSHDTIWKVKEIQKKLPQRKKKVSRGGYSPGYGILNLRIPLSLKFRAVL